MLSMLLCPMHCAVNGGSSVAVDIFNATAGTWTTATLSEGRGGISATSLPTLGLAIFAGGYYSNAVDIFNATAGTWTTAILSEARSFPAATSLPNLGVAFFAGGFGTSCGDCFLELQ